MPTQTTPYRPIPKIRVPIRNIADYSPFGVQLDGRTVSGDFYRRGFNGMEKDDEVKGGGNSYDFGARMFDARVGRFLSKDPLESEYPFYSPYQSAGLNPIKFVDLDGLEAYIKGTAGNELLNMMAQRSGLSLSLDANGLLSFATTTVVTEGVETTTPKINNASSDFVSETFRNELIAVINGADANGNKKSVVEYLAYTSQEIAQKHGLDNVFFDSYGKEAIFQKTQNYVDVTDLSNVQNTPELQTAILTHITTERGYGSYTFGHPKAMLTELKVIQEMIPGSTQRSDDESVLKQYSMRDAGTLGFLTGSVTCDYWDYKNTGYLFVGSSTSTPKKNGKGNEIMVNPNEVQGAIKIE